MARSVNLLLMLALAMGLAACQHRPGVLAQDDAEDYQPPVLDYSKPPTTSGGLFRGSHSGSLIQDKRALQVGDILTVVLQESTQSSKSAGTSYGKSSSLSMGVPKLLGTDIANLESSASSGRDFSGSAKSSQQNTLTGAIAVTVHQVLPNGTLLVKGEKALHLNQGDEFIRVSGLVRLEDINNNNQVSSQNLANARISYAGRGVLDDSNTAGWLSRFFAHPFYPL